MKSKTLKENKAKARFQIENAKKQIKEDLETQFKKYFEKIEKELGETWEIIQEDDKNLEGKLKNIEKIKRELNGYQDGAQSVRGYISKLEGSYYYASPYSLIYRFRR